MKAMINDGCGRSGQSDGDGLIRYGIMLRCGGVLLLLCLSGWLYNNSRSMAEVFGWSMFACLSGFVISFVLCMCLVFGLVVFGAGGKVKTGRLILTTFWTCLVASVVMEAVILRDEVEFAIEVHQVRASEGVDRYSRGRSWPTIGASLLWSEEDGYWASD